MINKIIIYLYGFVECVALAVALVGFWLGNILGIVSALGIGIYCNIHQNDLMNKPHDE